MQSPENGGTAASIILANRLEAVINLLYLVRLDRNDPDKVLGWVNLADEQLKRIVEILQQDLH